MIVLAALLLAVQPPAGSGGPPPGMQPPPAFIQAAQAFGQCVGGNVQSVPATVTPETGAAQALAGCAQQKAALEAQFESWISGPSFPEAGRAMAREQFRSQMGQATTRIADGIRQSRAAPAQSPAN